LNSSDVFILASFYEGWSTSIIEALACCRPVVTTFVSSASELIKPGENGYILYERDPMKLCNLINKSILLDTSSMACRNKINKYSIDNLGDELKAVWSAINTI
jgi:glycosyltransferase involved in cell wall biosynthesis